jgi:SAM-dependent methyltransferase
MASQQPFLQPAILPTTLDNAALRRAILRALRAELPSLRGTVLDLGCGRSPYRRLLLSPPSGAERYVGVDLGTRPGAAPDLTWDGSRLPLADASVECAVATEVFEHLPEPEQVLVELYRVIKPGGVLLFTTPFLWPLHEVPADEQRFTPFRLERLLRSAGFAPVELRALGGWNASLAQMLGLWARRRHHAGRLARAVTSLLCWPLVSFLAATDRPPSTFGEGAMILGLSGRAGKPR